MDGSIGDAHAGDSSANSLVVHDEVEPEVFDEESAVIGERPAKEGVQHGMSSAVGHGAGSIGLFCMTEGVPFPYSLDCPPKARW